MDYVTNIFESEENFRKFLENSVTQYTKLKFKNKENLISFIRKKFNINIPKKATYIEISQILAGNSRDLYKDVLGVFSPLEAAHLYSFYKILTEILWETAWVRNFSPFYTFLFNQKIKITKKSEHRKYAAEIVTMFNQPVLEQKWLEYSITQSPLILYGVPSHVIHYEHLTVGPLGFVFSLHYREKEVFGNYEPPLAILVGATRSGVDIVDWEKTDSFKLFLTILKEINEKIAEVTSTYPIYDAYLKAIRFDFSYKKYKNRLRDFVKLFKSYLKEDKVPVEFYQLVQLSSMFFKEEEIIDVLNRMIAEGILVINAETEIEYLRITKDGIIKRPKSWMARPAFELANDISEFYGLERLGEILTEILRKGAIKYLEELFDADFKIFKQVCARRKLYRFASLDKHLIPKERAIRLVLESYGLQIPSTLALDLRRGIFSFLKELEKFEREYKKLDNQKLTRRIIEYLREGRTIVERILKEYLFVVISLIFQCEEALLSEPIESAFILDRPIFYLGYDAERKIEKIGRTYREFLNKLAAQPPRGLNVPEELKNKIKKYSEKGRIQFTLGDWLSLLKLSVEYMDEKRSEDIRKTTLSGFYERLLHSISKIEGYLLKANALKWLNIASHERAMKEIHENVENRKNALDAVLRLRSAIISGLQGLPEVVAITGKVTEVKTGLEYYEAECTGIRKRLRIYGTRFLEPQFLYYLIQQFDSGKKKNGRKDESIVIYPVLITNLTDMIF